MTGFSRLALVEAKLFLREKTALIGVFGLPVALVIGFGLIPGFSDPQKGLSDQIGTEYIAGLGVAIVLASLGLAGVPMVIGQYRQRGILRRLGVTPVRPLTLLLADLMVWAASAVLSVALVVAVVRFVFHVPVPAAAGWFVLSVGLGQVREPARDPLSQRELDILGLIARGYSNREAAARLFISEATVKTHVLHIYAKLGVNDRAAAVAAGFERGLLPRSVE
jgi:DNA-binding CsgD family transcriptional regulator